MFCGRHLLASKLRRSNIDGLAGAVEEVARIVGQIRARWPEVRIVLRADSGFAREAVIAWCEQNQVDYLFILARNGRLVDQTEAELAEAAIESAATGAPARRFEDFLWMTLDRRSRRQRVVGKAEHTQGEANPRFVVTSLGRQRADARTLYEDLYCARGEMENRIKECQLDLFADRTSTATMLANQLRLWFASMAYVLFEGLRRIGLKATKLTNATCGSNPSQTPQGRCPGPHLRPPRQDRHGVDLPPPARLGARLCRLGRTALTRTRQRKADITIANSTSARMTELAQTTPPKKKDRSRPASSTATTRHPRSHPSYSTP